MRHSTWEKKDRSLCSQLMTQDKCYCWTQACRCMTITVILTCRSQPGLHACGICVQPLHIAWQPWLHADLLGCKGCLPLALNPGKPWLAKVIELLTLVQCSGTLVSSSCTYPRYRHGVTTTHSCHWWCAKENLIAPKCWR